MNEPYNPLDKRNLARSIEGALLRRPAIPLSKATKIVGAGVYALYYAGDFAPYSPIRADHSGEAFDKPIYVGKAIPKGGRTGGLDKNASEGTALNTRLGTHRRSINQSDNLSLDDFWVRFLIVDDIWIPLGENVLIQGFQPIWNVALFGFGNNAPGRGREKQIRSPWDALHPGRTAFKKLSLGDLTEEFLLKRVRDHFNGTPLDPLPSSVRNLLDEIESEAEEAADVAQL
jgi:hypothetical protein